MTEKNLVTTVTASNIFIACYLPNENLSFWYQFYVSIALS